jgi:DhnA family fructose-bisphosphate aldolase class Ia
MGCRWSSGPTRAAATSRRRAGATPSTRSTTQRGWRWKFDPEKDKGSPAPYNELDVTPEEAVRQIVESAGRSLVVLSGGSKTDDETVISHTRTILEAGGSGVIFGRNVWQREWSEALEIIEQIKETLLSSVRRIP